MSIQINLKLSDVLVSTAEKYIKLHGFSSLQDFIREILREKLFEDEKVSGIYTYKAAESSLAKHWLTKEEDEAWEHLQEET